MSEYLVKLIPNEDDDFELEGKNVGRVIVQNKLGENITSDCTVQIELNKEGLLGLGTELIRLAMRFQDGRHVHISPVDRDLISQSLGIYLTPDSCQLIVGCTEFNVINEYVE